MSDIEKSKSDLTKKNRPHPEWNVGDILLDIGHSGSDLLKITKLTKKKISYLRWCHYTDRTHDWNDSPSTYEWDKFEYFHSNCIKLEKDWEEYEKEALLEIQDMEQLEKKLGLKDVSDETQLARTGNKDMLTAAK